MKANIQKSGNSLALRIPLAVARQIRVKEGDEVELSVGAGASRSSRRWNIPLSTDFSPW